MAALPLLELSPAQPVPVARDAPPAGTALSTPRLSVVLVNYRAWQDTTRLVRQLRDSACVRRGDAEVVIVDNFSPPHRVVPLLRRWPGVSLRRWGRNRGFARAANEGCRLSRGGWLLLLNPDMTVPPAFLDRVLRLTQRWSSERPRAGILGFRLHHADGSPQGSAGPFPTLAGTLVRLLLPRAWRKYHLRQAEGCRPVPWVSGCCLLVRRDCFADLGGFDRSFFLYYEDVDLCRRAWGQGWSVWYEPSLALIHHHPLHTRRVHAFLRLLTRHGLLTYAARHWRGWQLRLLAGVVQAEAWCRRWLAGSCGNRTAADLFGDLGILARALAGNRRRAARRLLERVVRREEERLGPAPVDRHSQPQPARPAGRLPRQRDAARAA
jgi:N-acetylglucosaminyl-diphospho-decaprenol L-rhamnosyltransferase